MRLERGLWRCVRCCRYRRRLLWGYRSWILSRGPVCANMRTRGEGSWFIDTISVESCESSKGRGSPFSCSRIRAVYPFPFLPESSHFRTPQDHNRVSTHRLANSDTAYTAVPCGLPTAITSWVIQILPEPIPTLSASAPAAMSCAACSLVTTLPAMTWRSG